CGRMRSTDGKVVRNQNLLGATAAVHSVTTMSLFLEYGNMANKKQIPSGDSRSGRIRRSGSDAAGGPAPKSGRSEECCSFADNAVAISDKWIAGRFVDPACMAANPLLVTATVWCEKCLLSNAPNRVQGNPCVPQFVNSSSHCASCANLPSSA